MNDELKAAVENLTALRGQLLEDTLEELPVDEHGETHSVFAYRGIKARAIDMAISALANPLAIPGVQELLSKERERCAKVAESTTVVMNGIVIESLNANRAEIVRRIRNLEPQ